MRGECCCCSESEKTCEEEEEQRGATETLFTVGVLLLFIWIPLDVPLSMTTLPGVIMKM